MIILYLQQFQGLLQQFLKLFFTVLLIMDPIGILPQFLAYNGRILMRTHEGTIIRHSVIIAGLVLLVFVIFGRVILLFFGITPGAFLYFRGNTFFYNII
jgi:multiple antibiotic resistance protein